MAWGPSPLAASSPRSSSPGDDSDDNTPMNSSPGNTGTQLYLALGTMGLDPHLELACVDFSSSSSSLPVVASVCASSPFQCIAWEFQGKAAKQEEKTGGGGRGDAGVGETPAERRALGLLAGGMADGDVTLWDPEALLK